jgi:hypothetical protein
MSDEERSKIVGVLSLVRDIKWNIKYKECSSQFIDDIYKKIRELEKITQEIIYEGI